MVNSEILLLPRGFVKSSHNEGNAFLEQYVGVPETSPPVEVELNLRNRLVLLWHSRDVTPRPLAYFILGIHQHKLARRAFYMQEFNTCFNWANDRKSKSQSYLHEIMHSIHFAVNPKLLEQTVEEHNNIVKSDQQDVPLLAIERKIVRSFLLEGVAIWGAETAISRHRYGQNTPIEEWDEQMRRDMQKYGKYRNMQKGWIDDVAPVAIKKYQDAFCLTGSRREKAVYQADAYLDPFNYLQSRQFVKHTIEYAVAGGLSSPEALLLIMEHIPGRIEDVRDPDLFAQLIQKPR